jgi:uncharacterized membrane protein
MAKTNIPSHPGVSGSRLTVIRLLSVLALAVSAYLFWLALTGAAAVGCGPDSGCNEVLKSRWSKWFGVPVSAFALVLYSVVLAASSRLAGGVSRERADGAWKLILPSALLILGAALWFAIVQIFILKSICPYCMTAHGIGAVLAVVLLRSTLRAGGPGITIVPAKQWQRAVLVALVGVAVLVIGQTLQPVKTYQIAAVPVATNAAPANPPTPAPVALPAVTQAPAPPPKRLVRIHGGAMEIDLDDVPVMGSPGAEHVMVSLFDYTCHHCRFMHGPLSQVQKGFSNQLAIVSLPMPLDGACNPLMTKTPEAHVNACSFAKLGLAVWRADRRRQAEFDDWLFAPEHPPALDEAREFARKLVGAEALAKAESDPWVGEQLKRDIAIYTQAYHDHRKGAMPQLYIGTNVVFGPISSVPFFKLLGESYGLVWKPK